MTAASYHQRVAALTDWLMAAPGVPEPLTLEAFLDRPASTRPPARAWYREFIRGPKADYGALSALCESCPVRLECLEAALADESLVGLW